MSDLDARAADLAEAAADLEVVMAAGISVEEEALDQLNADFRDWRCWRAQRDGTPSLWVATRKRQLRPSVYQLGGFQILGELGPRQHNTVMADTDEQLRRLLTEQQRTDAEGV